MQPVLEPPNAPVVKVDLIEAGVSLGVKPADNLRVGVSGPQEGVKVIPDVFGKFGNFAAVARLNPDASGLGSHCATERTERLNGRRTSVKLAIVEGRLRRKRLHRDPTSLGSFDATGGSPYLRTVSYTHLTLPTNREV